MTFELFRLVPFVVQLSACLSAVHLCQFHLFIPVSTFQALLLPFPSKSPFASNHLIYPHEAPTEGKIFLVSTMF